MTTLASIKEKLLGVEYEHPFRWDIDLTKLKMTHSLDMLLYRISLTPGDVLLYIQISYVYRLRESTLMALGVLEVAEGKVMELAKYSPNATSENPAYLHVVRSMKAYLLSTLKNTPVAALEEMMHTIATVNDMTLINKTDLHILEARFHAKFGIEGCKRALNFMANEGIQIHPAKIELWNFFKAKYMGRVRRVERPRSSPDQEEIRHLVLATKTTKPECQLYVADLCREEGKRIQNRSLANQFNEKACVLYNCAKGLLWLPSGPCQDLNLVKQLLCQGFVLDPYSYIGHYVMAKYYEHAGEMNWRQKAIVHLRLCDEARDYIMDLELIRLEYSLYGKEVNIIERLEGLLRVYEVELARCMIFAQLSSFYLLVEGNLYKACQYAGFIAQLTGNYEFVKRHVPFCQDSETSQIIDLRSELMDQIAARLDGPVENRDYFEAFLAHLTSPDKESVPEPPADFRIWQVKSNESIRRKEIANVFGFFLTDRPK